VTEERKIDRYAEYNNPPGLYRRDDGEFVGFDDHERIVSEMHHEIERFTAENRRLKNKCNSLCRAINQSTPERCLSKDDLKLEVIE